MITVAICTYNRAELLDKTLDRLQSIRKPAHSEWEVLVVNNRCTDGTDAVIEKYVSSLPLRRIYQPVQGLSNARNAAVENARGNYILWTDDDVLVSDGWLQAYEEAFERYPDAAIFGGPIEPWFEVDPPAWLAGNWQRLASAFAARDLGDDELRFDFSKGLIPYGANFCIRAQEQKAALYDPVLGRNGGKTVLGEETEVVRKILADGGHGWWLPNASVRHWIPSGRMTKEYVLDYFHGLGRTQVLVSPPDDSTTLFGVPRWKLRQLAQLWLTCALNRLKNDPDSHLRALCDLEVAKGELSTIWENRR